MLFFSIKKCIGKVIYNWVITENIHTPPTEEIGSNPPSPFECSINTLTIIINTFFSPSPHQTAQISSLGGGGLMVR
jgi:hypothetical protein